MPRARKANSNKPKKQPSNASRRAAPRGPVEPRKAATGPGAERNEPLTRQDVRDVERLREIERQQRKLEEERQRLLPRVAAREPPTLEVRSFAGKRKGFTYHTWFKAIGFMDRRGGRNEDISQLLEETLEFEEGSIPAAFISHGITGKVKYMGIRDREELINDLNSQADWAPMDFRDVYPNWEYTYRIVESVGNVPVAFYEYRAARPRRRGLNTN